VAFLLVYLREAHPDTRLETVSADGQRKEQVIRRTPSAAARLQNLRLCSTPLGLSMPAAVDSDDNAASRAYAAWPIRLVVVDAQGKIAFKGNRTWAGFRVDALETWLRNHVPLAGRTTDPAGS